MMKRTFGAALVLAMLGGGAAPGQEAAPDFLVCQSQQDLEQHLASAGELVPEGCRRAQVVAVESDVGPLCVIDLGEVDEGILDTLRDVAMTTQWWALCEEIGAQLPDR